MALAGPAGRLCGCLKHPRTGSPYAHHSADSEADACETWAGSGSRSSAGSRAGDGGGSSAGHRVPDPAHTAAVKGVTCLQHCGFSRREGCPPSLGSLHERG